MSGSQSSILEWKFMRDGSGRLTRVSLPGGKETLLSYEHFPDDAENVKAVTRRFSGGEVVCEYDRWGRRTAVTDQTGTIHYEWDPFGQITRVRRSIGPGIEYRYDSLFRLKGYRAGSEFDVEYAYDFLGRIEAIKTLAGTMRYEYWTGQGRTIRILPNGIRTIWDHEPDGQLASITHVDPNDYQIARFSHSYRPDGLIERILEWSPRGERQLSYEYDAVQRLAAVSDSAGKSWRSNYDSLGNRTKEIFGDGYAVDYRYDWAGRLTSVNGVACEHDDSGNLSLARLDGTLRRFEFDHDNRICRANQGEVKYEYDGDGFLVTRTCRGERTVFIPDPFSDEWHPLVELLPNGRQRFYLWDDRTPLAVVENGTATFFLHDHIGSVRCIADRSGQVTERRDYSAFGVFDGLPSDSGLVPGFAGLFWDSAASVYLARARAYSPDLGRFLQMDPQHRVPFGSQKELSAYVYCGDDPVNFWDTTGLMPERADDGDAERRGPAGMHGNVGGGGEGDGNGDNSTGRPGNDPVPDDHGSRPAGLDSDGSPGGRPDKPQPDLSSGVGGTGGSHRGGRSPAEGQKEFTPELAAYVIKEVTDNVNTYSKAKFGSESGLTETQIQEARRFGLQQFFVDHFGDDQYSGPKFGMIKNCLIPSPYGTIDLDWFSTLGYESSCFFNLPLSLLYVPGKLYWFLKRKTSPDWKSSLLLAVQGRWTAAVDALFPLAGWNAARMGDDLSSGRISIEEALTRGRPTITRRGVSTRPDRPAGDMAPKLKLRRQTSLKPWDNYPPPWFQFPRWLWNVDSGDQHRRDPMPMPLDLDCGSSGSSSVAPLSPSPVGGVFLGGAGALLDGLGQVTGVAIDRETGRLILLTEHAGSIALPPLRIDDVVTVFRSVYLHGEGPSVTINPRPVDPHGPWMDVVHGAATNNTYVGWVLFEADRIMKAYNLGEDNISRTPVSSAVAGHDEVLHTVYFGGDFADGKKTGGNWERFWIVPAEVSRFHASSRDLTLFDVPLKVKTQRMVLKNGKLEDAQRGKSSKGALAFVVWFTRAYEGIASEQFLQPPPETGISAPVPVFSELRRIALISAVAEQLRDQGVPMPLWIKDYEVKKIPVPSSTPTMTVAKTEATGSSIVTASIYGGVNLSVPDEAVKQFDRGSDFRRLTPAQREVCTRQVAAAEDLAPAIIGAARAKPILAPISVQRGSRHVHVVALPGSESKALAPCRLEEVDLDVPVQGGGRVALVRHFNSFFTPVGPWGRGWSTDWPHLAEVKLPLERSDKSVKFRLVYELSTPLGRIRARFSETRHVPELNAMLAVPDHKCEVLALAAANDPLVKQGTTEIVFKDGRIWFFDENGDFAGEQAKPFSTVYLRDSTGRVRQLIRYEGDQARAAVHMVYDALGRLECAQSEDDTQRITYQYGGDGMLESVTSAEGRTSYTYERGLVKTISWSARIDGERFEHLRQREFEYAPNGQLLAERAADGTRTSYAVEMQDGRYRMAVRPQDGSVGTTAIYDERLRPLEVTEADNTRTRWTYETDGGTKTETALPDGEVIKTTLSADGKHKVVETSDKVLVQEDRDDGGRLTNMSLNQRSVLQQTWHPNGLLRSMSCETHSVIPQYDEHGRMQSALRVKPAEGDKFRFWQETQFDESGRVRAVKDYTGSDVEVGYDARGDVESLVTKRDGKDYGLNIKRNTSGQIEQVHSLWGQEERRYDANGGLEEVVVKKGPATAKAEYSDGCIVSLIQYDGGRLRFDYHADGEEEGRLKSVQTPAIALNYHYSPAGKLAALDLGDACRINYEHDAQGNLERLAFERR